VASPIPVTVVDVFRRAKRHSPRSLGGGRPGGRRLDRPPFASGAAGDSRHGRARSAREQDGVVTDTEVTARELAVVAGRTVPRATPWRRLVVPRVPLAGEGRPGRCKRCGRALPWFSDPLAFGPMGRFPVVRLERSTMESALLCLVCGPRSSAGRPFSRAEVLAGATELSAVLAARHWRRWHRLLDRAVATGGGAGRIAPGGAGA